MSDWSSPGHVPPPQPSPLREIVHLWTLSLNGLRVEARVFEHVLGCELRIPEAGELRRSQVHRSTAGAYQDARDTYARLAGRGAVPVD